MLRVWIFVVGLFSLCASTLAPPSFATEPTKPLVLLISLDGFKPSYLSPELTPNLLALAQRGIRAQGLISAFPSLTFPNHVTIVSGQTPDHHGIVHNTMSDPGTAQRFSLAAREAVENPFWWQEARPIWIALREQGRVVSTLFWPGSETPIRGWQPNDWLRYEHEMTHEARLATLFGWLARAPAERPELATLYFADVDSAGHAAGTDSAALRRSVQKVDQSIGLLIERLKQMELLDSTTLVVVSDHGMTNSPPTQVIAGQSALARFPAARWEWLGATAGVRLNGESSAGVLEALAGLANLSCWPKESMPARFRFGAHRRIPEIVCLADLGYTVSDHPARSVPAGQHGYDPEDPAMHGLLIVAGPRIQKGSLGLVSNLEIYGLLCRLLGLNPEPNDGSDTLSAQVIRP